MFPHNELIALVHKSEALLKSEKHLDRIVGALCNMNLESVETELEGMVTCNDRLKEDFLSDLGQAFRAWEERGNRYLLLFTGRCHDNETCLRSNHPGFVFVTDNTRDYFSLRFIMDGDQVLAFSESPCIRTPVAMRPKAVRLTLTRQPF